MIIKKNIIVVTGGAGFIGSNLIKFLLIKTNLKIISLDNYSTGVSKNHVNNSRVKYLKGSTTEINTKLDIYKKKLILFFTLVSTQEFIKVLKILMSVLTQILKVHQKFFYFV